MSPEPGVGFPTKMTRRLGVGTAVVTAALLVGGCGGSRQATSLPGLTAWRLAKLKALAQANATAASSYGGSSHVSGAMVYATTYRQALLAMGMKGLTAQVDARPVYLVVEHGHFDCAGCQDGQAPVTGDIAYLVLDRRTLRSLYSAGIGDHANTSRLGPGLPISVGP